MTVLRLTQCTGLPSHDVDHALGHATDVCMQCIPREDGRIQDDSRKQITWAKQYLVRLLASRELQVRAVLVVRDLRQRDLPPEVGSEERVRFCELQTHCLSEILRVDCKKTLTASKVAFKKLPIVAVEPLDCV